MAAAYHVEGKERMEDFVGSVVRAAARHNIPVPATRTVYALLKMIDARIRDRTRSAIVGFPPLRRHPAAASRQSHATALDPATYARLWRISSIS